MRSPCRRTPPANSRHCARTPASRSPTAACCWPRSHARTDRELRRASRQRGGATRPRLTGLTAYAGEVAAADPRPLLGEPLPLDLLNTTWMSGDGLQDLLADERGARIFLDEHGFDATADAAARRALRETREALRALLLDRDAAAGRQRRAGARRRAAAAAAPAASERGRRGAGVAGAVDLRRGVVTLLESRGDRVAACANPDCVLWFLDTSRPGTRRWCSMAACGNRDKAIRHGRTQSPVTLINRLIRYGGEHDRARHHVRHGPRRPQRRRPRAHHRLLHAGLRLVRQGARGRLRVPRRRHPARAHAVAAERRRVRHRPRRACTTSRSRSIRWRTCRPPRRACARPGRGSTTTASSRTARARPAAGSSSRTPTASAWRSSPAPASTARAGRSRPDLWLLLGRWRCTRVSSPSSARGRHRPRCACRRRTDAGGRAEFLTSSRGSCSAPTTRRPRVGERAVRPARLHLHAGRRTVHDRGASRSRATRSPARWTDRSAGSRSSPARAAACASTARRHARGRRDDRARPGLLELPEVHRDARRRGRRADRAPPGARATRSTPGPELLAAADTAFVATRGPDGLDASHRGGSPGFLHVVDEHTIVWPDYSGQPMFNTLGNIAVDPAAGLTVVDPADGTTLYLSGRAEIAVGRRSASRARARSSSSRRRPSCGWTPRRRCAGSSNAPARNPPVSAPTP